MFSCPSGHAAGWRSARLQGSQNATVEIKHLWLGAVVCARGQHADALDDVLEMVQEAYKEPVGSKLRDGGSMCRDSIRLFAASRMQGLASARKESNVKGWSGLPWVIALLLAGCGGDVQETSRVQQAGFIIEFTPACIDGEIALAGAISNSTNELLWIYSGSLPWHYDTLGSEFQAESGGVKLDRHGVSPPIGKTGPIPLRPKERRQGRTPIEFMFPGLKSALRKDSVTISYSYPLRLNSQRSEDWVEGKIEIRSDPCDP